MIVAKDPASYYHSDMKQYRIAEKSKLQILALGAESAGNFSVYKNGVIYHSEDFGDLMQLANWTKYQANLNEYLKTARVKPDIILSDLHPLFKTTALAKELAIKYKAKHVPVQHHIAHIFSAIADKKILNTKYLIPNTFLGIALDGTGYGTDEKIWGGEVIGIFNNQFSIFNQISNPNDQISKNIIRFGHLENQIMIGGEKAIEEPARILLAIASKFKSESIKLKAESIVRKYYSKNEINVLQKQLIQNFNCIETSSCGRILDAVSLLLGFCKNERNYKHEPINLLEKNSTKPYNDIAPTISCHSGIFRREKYPESTATTIERNTITSSESYSVDSGHSPEAREFRNDKIECILQTTPLFEYLLKNLRKDKHRLAATAQLYIAQGLYEIIKNCHPEPSGCHPKLKECHPELVSGSQSSLGYSQNYIFASGGLANNKIISSYLESKGVYTSKKIPRGDAGLSVGQIFYNLLSK